MAPTGTAPVGTVPIGTTPTGTAASEATAPAGGTTATAAGPGQVENRLASLAVVALGLPGLAPQVAPTAPTAPTATSTTSSDPVSTISAITALTPATSTASASLSLATAPDPVASTVGNAAPPPLAPPQLADAGDLTALASGQPIGGTGTVLPQSIPEPGALHVGLLTILFLAARGRFRRRSVA